MSVMSAIVGSVFLAEHEPTKRIEEEGREQEAGEGTARAVYKYVTWRRGRRYMVWARAQMTE